MNTQVLNITGGTADDSVSELLFALAQAKADGAELLRVGFREDAALPAGLLRRLKQLLRVGKIAGFATDRDFAEKNGSAGYFLNKYPDLAAGTEGEHPPYLIIKI